MCVCVIGDKRFVCVIDVNVIKPVQLIASEIILEDNREKMHNVIKFGNQHALNLLQFAD